MSENMNRIIEVLGGFFKEIPDAIETELIYRILCFSDNKPHSIDLNWQTLETYLKKETIAQSPTFNRVALDGRLLCVIALIDYILLSKMSPENIKTAKEIDQSVADQPDPALQKTGMQQEFLGHQAKRDFQQAFSVWQQLRTGNISPDALVEFL